MYNFIKNMWIMGRYTATNIANCVTKGYITQDQANTIMTMAQVTTTISSTSTSSTPSESTSNIDSSSTSTTS